MSMGPFLSIITLNANGLNAPSKRQTLTEWIQKQDPIYTRCLQETHLKGRDTYRLKVKGWKKNISPNGDQKEVGVAILISDKIENKGCEKRQRRTLHNDQRINPIRRHNNYKYICTKHRSTAIRKANAN